MAGRKCLRMGNRSKPTLAAIEGVGVECRQQGHEQGQEQVRPQLQRIGEREIGYREQRLPTGEHAIDAVGDDAGDPCRNDDFRLELRGTVQHLPCEDRSGQRGTKDGTDAGPHPCGHQHTTFGGTQPQHVAQQRAEPGPDLGNRPLTSTRSARAERNRTGDDLDQRNTRADLPLLVVIGRNHGIRAMSFGLGSEGEDEHAADEAADCRDHQQEPRIKVDVPLREATTSQPRRQDAAPGSSLRQRRVRNVPQHGSPRRRRLHRVPPRRPPVPPTPRVESASENGFGSISQSGESTRGFRSRTRGEADVRS